MYRIHVKIIYVLEQRAFLIIGGIRGRGFVIGVFMRECSGLYI